MEEIDLAEELAHLRSLLRRAVEFRDPIAGTADKSIRAIAKKYWLDDVHNYFARRGENVYSSYSANWDKTYPFVHTGEE
jgi:hypothetical protein